MIKFFKNILLLTLVLNSILLYPQEKDALVFSKGTLFLNSKADVGDLLSFEGNNYLVVDNKTLRDYINNGGDLSKVVTSKVTDMSFLFYKKTSFLGDISAWDTSNVTTMSKMFCWSEDLKPNVVHWDTSNVIDFGDMFRGNTSFNQEIGHWNVSKGVSFAGMFHDSNFNQNINDWDVSNAIDMSGMFDDASYFNHPLDKWDVSNVKNMGGMFAEAISFNQDISTWNVANVTSMRNMFRNATSFNQNLSKWKISNIKDVPIDFNLNANFIEPQWRKGNLTVWGISIIIVLLSSLGILMYNRISSKKYTDEAEKLLSHLKTLNKKSLSRLELDEFLNIQDKSLDSQKRIRASYINKINALNGVEITRKRSAVDSRTYLYEVKSK